MKGIRTPHIFAVLFIAILIAAAATWIVPSGAFDRTEGPGGRMVIVPGSYETIAPSPAGPMDVLKAIPSGLADSAAVVFGVMMVGGAFGVIGATQTIDIALKKATVRFRGKEIIMVPIIMVIFSLIASFIGTPELSLVYIPIILSLCLANGWDSMAAVGITLIGVTAGFSTALINPFSTGIAQQIAEVPGGSGMGYRALSCAVLLVTGIAYTMRYMKRVAADPSKSITAGEDRLRDPGEQNLPDHLCANHILTLVTLLVGIAVLVYGIVAKGWYMAELAAIFVAVTVVVGAVNRMGLNDIAESFADGCRSVLIGALVVGFARGVALILENGMIMDTIVNALSNIVGSLPEGITAAGMVVIQTLVNSLVPSSSGQAVISMPIMVSLADLAGVTRQTAILAFQFGDGMSNILFPTSGYFMATIAMAGVPYQKWLKFFGPLFAIWIASACVLVVIAQSMGWA